MVCAYCEHKLEKKKKKEMTRYFFLSLNVSEKKGRDLKQEEEEEAEWRKRRGQVAALRVCRSHAKRCASGLIYVPSFGPQPLGCSFFIAPSRPQVAPPSSPLASGKSRSGVRRSRGRLRQDSQDSAESLALVGVFVFVLFF